MPEPRTGGVRGALPPPPIFGRSVYPIPTRGWSRFSQPFNTCTLKFFHLLASLTCCSKRYWLSAASIIQKENALETVIYFSYLKVWRRIRSWKEVQTELENWRCTDGWYFANPLFSHMDWAQIKKYHNWNCMEGFIFFKMHATLDRFWLHCLCRSLCYCVSYKHLSGKVFCLGNWIFQHIGYYIG